MKRTLVLFAGGILLMLGCNKTSNPKNETIIPEEESFTATQRQCGSYDVLQEQLKNDPAFKTRMDAIEEFTKHIADNPEAYRLLPNGTIEIPVVFNVLYRTTAQNVSQAQLQSQIDVLNEDYAGTNADHNLTITYNNVKAGNIGVRFVLDHVKKEDPQLNPVGQPMML